MLAVERYDADWVRQYDATAREIESAIEGVPHRLEHIGGTSVTGLSAKPVIDVMVGTSQDRMGDTIFIDALGSLGYRFLGYGRPGGRLVFVRRADGRNANIHLTWLGSYEWRRLLAIRDYLRFDADAAGRYGRLKLRLSELYTTEEPAYGFEKRRFMDRLEFIAVRWSRAADIER